MTVYLRDKVIHPEIYKGKEIFTVVGIRENELELEGDWSGGTYNVKQKHWFKKEGVIKVLPENFETKIRLFSGKFFDFSTPSADDITLEDIAKGLSREFRFTGQTKRPYSVAQHTVYCSLQPGTPLEQFERLHHDDSESIMKDIPKPLKNLLPDYQELENKIQEVLNKKFDIPFPLSESCHKIDKEIFTWEYKGIMLNEYDFEYWDIEKAEKLWLERHYELLKMLGKEIELNWKIGKLYLTKFQTAEKVFLKEVIRKPGKKDIEGFKVIYEKRPHIGICYLNADRLIYSE